MRLLLVLAVVTVVLYDDACGDHLVVGNVADRVNLMHQEHVEYFPIPFIKRVKNYFFTSPNNKAIAGIQVLDNVHSKSSLNITAGGVGYPFVNIRMKSERGEGMDFDVGIYSYPEKIY